MPETLARTVFKFNLLSLTHLVAFKFQQRGFEPLLMEGISLHPLCLFNFVFGHFDFVFVDIIFALRQFLCIPGWSLSCYVVESVLGFLIPLLPRLQCWDCKHATQRIPLCLLSELRGAALLAALPSNKGL